MNKQFKIHVLGTAYLKNLISLFANLKMLHKLKQEDVVLSVEFNNISLNKFLVIYTRTLSLFS